MSDKITKIIEEVDKLTVIELSELVKALEEKFGVSAAPLAVASAPVGEAGTSAADAPEQTTFNVVLTNAGANKISVIKAVREVVPTLGLAEAKTLVESAPKEVVTGVNKETAQEAKTKLEAAGATVELK
ncbi:MAG: 50S ribosomal protein L7/L12 [Patescibacteria group bacterium]|nr:50S ribosomal protein L7/L12 [Patescibacteria group bacterium]